MRKRRRNFLGRPHVTVVRFEDRVEQLADAHPHVDRALVASIAHHSRDELARLERGREDLDEMAYRFAKERIECVDRARRPDVTRVLFLSSRNDGLSQMAPALLNHASSNVMAMSAGTRPTGRVLRTALDVLAEAGVDTSACFPKPLTTEVLHAADVIVTMLVDAPTVHDGQRVEDWPDTDPAGLGTADVRILRDRLQLRVSELLQRL